MTQPLPFKPAVSNAAPPPPWIQATPPAPLEQVIPRTTAAEERARILAEFEMVFPRVLQRIYAGDTISKAVSELPIAIDYGAFNRWLRKDARRKGLVEEAEEARTEVWADRILEHAEGKALANGEVSTIERDKFSVDVYKFLMGRQNKKRYGENKVLDVNHTISIAAALEESSNRVIEATVIYDDALPEDENELRMLVSGDDDSGDDE